MAETSFFRASTSITSFNTAGTAKKTLNLFTISLKTVSMLRTRKPGDGSNDEKNPVELQVVRVREVTSRCHSCSLLRFTSISSMVIVHIVDDGV